MYVATPPDSIDSIEVLFLPDFGLSMSLRSKGTKEFMSSRANERREGVEKEALHVE